MNAERHVQEPALRALQGHGRRRRIRTSSRAARFRRTTTTRAAFRTRSRPRTSAVRVDYNHSETDRFFFRASGTTFYEYNADWTYETKFAGLHSNDKTRASWSYTGNWTKVLGSTVIDTQVSANRFYEDQQRRGLHEYKPTDVGLPSYLDEFCQSAEQLHAADDQHRRLPGRVDRRRRRPRHHQSAGPEQRDQRQGHAHAARRRRLSPGDAPGRIDGGRQRVVQLQLRQHLHPRGGHDGGVPDQQRRPEPGGPHARASRRRCRSGRTRRSR